MRCAETYTYDAENRIIQVVQGSTTVATYAYDADGQRVHRTGVTTDTCDGTGNRDYAYDLAGQWILEVDNAGTQCKSEIYAGGRHYVTDVDGQTYFDHSDWLGTVRARNTYAGPSSFQTCTSLPFGDALTCTGDNSTIHFTGKERDSESGLDNFGARYNSSQIGRFMSPDSPSYSNHKNPQSWNLYAFALNNPVTFKDADGHTVVCSGSAQSIYQCQKDAAMATGNAQAASRVTTQTTQHGWWIFKWSETSLKITGDINTFRALSTNAAKLADLVTSKDTITVSYGNLARQSGWDTGLPLNGGSTSYMNPFLAIIDPTRTPGAVYDPDAVAQHIPQANTAEEFGHEVLGHIWGDMFGGAPAGTRANMRDSIVGEDAVRALDPTRGQKGIESHHNYNEMPPDPPNPK